MVTGWQKTIAEMCTLARAAASQRFKNP